MDDMRGDELRSVAAEVSLGRGADGYPSRLTPPLAKRAFAVGPTAWLKRLRPGAALVGLTPALATLFYIWGETGALDALLALCALGGVASALSGASLLEVCLDARRASTTLQEPRATRRIFVAGVALLLIAGLAGAPLALAGGLSVLALGAGGLALAVIYAVTSRALKRSLLGDLALFLTLGPGITLLVARSQQRPVTGPLWLLGLALGAFALTIPTVLHLRDRNANVEHGRWTVAALLGQTGGHVTLVASFAVGFTLLATFAAPVGAPHPALLAFLALPAVAVAVTGALRASEMHSRHLAARATFHAYVLIVTWLLVGLLVNSMYLRITVALTHALPL
jgi:1,4-dihydroxy-2-naphthoate octaprenyltransferase